MTRFWECPNCGEGRNRTGARRCIQCRREFSEVELTKVAKYDDPHQTPRVEVSELKDQPPTAKAGEVERRASKVEPSKRQPEGERWHYRTSWARVSEEGDEARMQKHLENWAAVGWELLSANAVQILSMHSERFSQVAPSTFSTYVIHHYFYWRRRA
jgi:hypothetical protein